MASLFEEGPRKVVPKWHLFADALKGGELAALHNDRTAPDSQNIAFKSRCLEFNANNTLYHAADLLTCAVVLGLEAEVKDAAKFVLESGDESMEFARRTAKRILDGISLSDLTQSELFQKERVEKRVGLMRSVLNAHSRNAFLWCDLALNYDSLGNHKKAERALQIARSLAPNDRFVLRAAAKFHHSIGDFDQAHRIVKRSVSTKYDPWLLATEIALSETQGKASQFLKIGRGMLDERKYSSFHLSELASSIGTFEFYQESTAKARRHLELSLVDPLENSIAQAAWMVTKNNFGLNNFRSELTTRSKEAKALDLHFDGRWKEAIEAIREWANDETYLITPQLMRASIHLTLQDSGAAIQCLLEARKVHGSSPILLNGLAFNYARSGDLISSQRAISLANRMEMPDYQRYVIMATNGYLHLKKGLVTPDSKLAETLIRFGRSEYERAIAGFDHIQNEGLKMLARIYLALAESEIKSDASVRMRKDVISKYQDSDKSEIKELLNQLRAYDDV